MLSVTAVIFLLSLLTANRADVIENQNTITPAEVTPAQETPTETTTTAPTLIDPTSVPGEQAVPLNVNSTVAPVTTDVPNGEVNVTAVPEIDYVIPLTTATFPAAINTSDLVFVEFYAPWCGHCKTLEPEYKKAANAITQLGLPIKLAKVDGTIEETLSAKYDVEGYPTMKLFRNGTAIDYYGGRTSEEILAWLAKKLSPPVVTLNAEITMEQLKNANNVTVILFAVDKESSQTKNFTIVADGFDEIAFGILSDVNEFAKHEVQNGSVVLYKNFDEPKTVYSGNDSNIESLKSFIKTYSSPLISELNEVTSQKIFDSDLKIFLLLFVSKAKDGFTNIVEPVKTVAKDYRGKVFFVGVDSDLETNHQLITFFGADIEDIPCMRIIQIENEVIRYKPYTNDLTPEAVKQFLDEYFAQKLTPMRDEFDDDDWNLEPEPVKNLYSGNFDDIVYDAEKDVLVEFYSPTCQVCKEFAPIYEQLGEAYKDRESVIISRINAIDNPMDYPQITEYPTIKLYTKKYNQMIDYNGNRLLRDLILFLETNLDRQYEKQYDRYDHQDHRDDHRDHDHDDDHRDYHHYEDRHEHEHTDEMDYEETDRHYRDEL